MEIIAIVFYVISSLMGAFAFNQVMSEYQKKLIPHGIAFLGMALLSVYFLLNEYFLEGLVSTVIFGLPLILSKGATPEFLYRKIKRFNIALIVIIVVFVIGVIMY